MSRKSEYEQMADQISATLRQRANERRPWREVLVRARRLSQVLGMCPSMRDDDGNVITETNDGCLRIGEEAESFTEDELDQVLVERGLQDHLWY